MPTKQPVVLSRKAISVLGALVGLLSPRLAQDAKSEDVFGPKGINLYDALATLTAKNYAAKKPSIVAAVKKGLKPAMLAQGMALDATIGDVTKFLEKIDQLEVAEGADADPETGMPMNAEQMSGKTMDDEPEDRKFLRSKLSADDMKAYDEMMAKKAEDAEPDDDEKDPPTEENPKGKVNEPAKDAKMGKDKKMGKDGKMGKDEPPPFKGKPEVGKGPPGVTKQAMDEAIAGEREKQKAIQTALREVRPWAGDLNMAFDGADEVYRAALRVTGMEADDVKELPALKLLLSQRPKPGMGSHQAMAHDSAPNHGDFATRWPDAARVGVI